MLSPEAKKLLELQRRKYLRSLSGKKDRIAACWKDVLDSGWEAGPVASLRTEVHKLSGSAGSYGLDELGDVARNLDLMLSDDADSPQRRHDIAENVHDLQSALDESGKRPG